MIDLFRLISMNSRSRSLRHRLAEKEAPAQIEDASTATPMPASFWTPFLTPELRFALTFLLIYLLLQGLYQQLPIGWIEASFIDWGAVRPSAALIDWLSPQSSTRIDGTAIVGQQARLSVIPGCEGSGTLFLLLAAILAYPTSWRARLIALPIGTLLIGTLNVLRITTLYFVLATTPERFEIAHGVIAPGLIVLLGALLFLGWTGMLARSNHSERAQENPGGTTQ